jgi:nucleoside-diphosphate-sugar epimerase/predicted dehydrogenase
LADTDINIGFLGAGYIARWHAAALKRVKGARLAGVCDRSRGAAEALSKATGAEVFDSLDVMLASRRFDCIHVLIPPHAHAVAARQILDAGVSAFVEKPLALSQNEAGSLVKLAAEKKALLGVNHNFLMLPGYDRLKRDLGAGVLGQIDRLDVNWRFPFPPLRSGPYDVWALGAPQNLLYELGPHLFAFIADLLPGFEPRSVDLRHPIELPGGLAHFQSWRISGIARSAAVSIDLSLIECDEDRSIELRGTGGLARFDYGSDIYGRRRSAAGELVLAPFAAEASHALQAARSAVGNAVRQALSLNELAPYGLSITCACQSFFRSLRDGRAVDRRLSGELGAQAVGMIERTCALAANAFRAPPKRPAAPSRSAADYLVIGGSGFIGRALVAQLASQGAQVRVFSRGRASGLERADGRVEIISGDLKSEADLVAAMTGVKGVFHLAKAEENSWAGYLENDVAVTRRIGECCLKAKVARLVYTGTIASYDASRPDRPINEATPFDHALEERDLYARSKAACEASLLELAKTAALPLVIVRPGIVIGRGGPLQHWGIARWRSSTAATLWGRGDNILPFVSIEDAADGLARAMTMAGVEGRSFNLVGEPMLSARDYFAEVGRANGVAMRARPNPIWAYYFADVVKYVLKRYVARRGGLVKPVYRNWATRAALSPFENAAAKAGLGWSPQANRAAFIARTIDDANLFGVSYAADDASEPAAREPASATVQKFSA